MAKVKPAIRKAYGVSKASPAKEPMAVLEAAKKIIDEAYSNPAQALSVGIVPADVTAIQQALADLTAAVTAAHAHGGKTTPTAKDRGVAAKRMHEATGRIAGAGVLAFAQNATVRAEFAALKPMKNV